MMLESPASAAAAPASAGASIVLSAVIALPPSSVTPTSSHTVVSVAIALILLIWIATANIVGRRIPAGARIGRHAHVVCAGRWTAAAATVIRSLVGWMRTGMGTAAVLRL